MKKLFKSLLDLFFPHDIDENGNKIENPEGDDSYSTKVFTIIILAITIIFTAIVLK